jgi:hypothetical protein
MVEVENSRISKYDPTLHFRIIRCILAGNDRDFPVVIPEQSDFRMNGCATIVETAGNHLKRFRADAPDAVIYKQLKREQLVVFDVVLKLLYAFVGEGIGCHKKVNRACLLKQVHD